jgi:hypothetical protein
MKKLIAIAGFVFLASCSSKSGFDKVLSDFEGFKNRYCKCTDKACADKVEAEAKAWMEKMEESMKGKEPTKEQDEKFDKIEEEIEKCEEKFKSAAPE